jgi:hypothetical protein
MRRRQTKPACMVRRRSTVRFRNGAQIGGLIRKDSNGSWMPVGTNGCPQALAARPAPFQPGHAGSSGDARQIPGSFVTEEPSAGQPAPVTAGSDMRRRLTGLAWMAIPARSRPVPRSSSPVPGQRQPGHGGESAGDGRARTVPTSRQPGRGEPVGRGPRPSARRWPGRHRGQHRAIARCRARHRIPPGPSRGHRLGHSARTSGGALVTEHGAAMPHAA